MHPTPQGRFRRLVDLLAQDPGNTLLMADAAEAALAEGVLDVAEQLIADGSRMDGDSPAWRFRMASLLIAQRRLAQARTVLAQLRAEGGHAAIDHNLAYIDFLDANFRACSDTLQPWMEARQAGATDSDAIESLWLRAMHHQQRLKEAWEWVGARGFAKLGAKGAGVASLIALDLNRLDAVQQLAAVALRADADHPEACIAAAGVALASRDMGAARTLLERVMHHHPHQARAWAMCGFVDLASERLNDACSRFKQALALAPQDSGTWLGLGWVHVMQGDLPASSTAFRRGLECDPESADAHGSLAVALAMQANAAEASAHIDHARRLQPGNVAARFAQAVLTGNDEGLKGVQRIAHLILSLAVPKARS